MCRCLFDKVSISFHNEDVKRFTLQRGFTLMELLVVISIIAILIALGAISYTTAQQKGRDARRQGDMRGWGQALEQYYADTSSAYPASCDPGATYLQAGIPSDPKGGSYAYTKTCTTSTYCLCAELESTGKGNSNDDGDTNADCTGLAAGTGDYFCVKNQQ